MSRSGLPALDLTRGPIGKTLLAFALPTLGSNALQSLNASVNAVWVGGYLGEAPLTAVTNSNAVLFLLMGVVFGIVMATGIMVGHAMGASDIDRAKRVVGSSAAFIVILSVLTALLGAITVRPILLAMGTPEDAMPFAVSYMRLVFIATPPMFFYIYVAMTLRGAADAKTPFIFMFVSVGLDIALNPLLIFGLGPVPALGIAGSGLAMLISQTTTLAAMLVLLYRRHHFLCIRRHELSYLRIDPAILKVLVLRGIPMGLQMIIVSSSMLAMLGLINRFGTDVTAAFGAAMQLWTYIQMPAFAIGSAVTVMVAQSIGAGQWDRVSRINWAGLAINFLITGGMIAIVYVFNHRALGFFLPPHSPAIDIAAHLNAVVLWSFVLFGATLVLMGVVRSTGAVFGPLSILFVSMWLVRIPFAYALAPRWHADAVWWSFPLGSLAALLLVYLYYRYGGWRKLQVMGAAKAPAPQPVEG